MFQNCKECHTFGRINRLGLCRSCNAVDENLIGHIRESSQLEGKTSVYGMADRIGINANRIIRYIEEGRLKSNLFQYTCPFCGGAVNDGRCKCPSFQTINSPLPFTKHPEKFHSTIRVDKRRQEYWDRKSNINRKQKRDIWIRT